MMADIYVEFLLNLRSRLILLATKKIENLPGTIELTALILSEQQK